MKHIALDTNKRRLLSIIQSAIQPAQNSTQQHETYEVDFLVASYLKALKDEGKDNISSAITKIDSLKDSETISGYQKLNLPFSFGLGNLIASVIIFNVSSG